MFRQLTEAASPSFDIYIDGVPVPACEGDTVAAVLLRTPPHIARHSTINELPRAPFCLMGVCFDCLAVVDGESSVQTCLVKARPGMRVERPTGKLRITP